MSNARAFIQGAEAAPLQLPVEPGDALPDVDDQHPRPRVRRVSPEFVGHVAAHQRGQEYIRREHTGVADAWNSTSDHALALASHLT